MVKYLFFERERVRHGCETALAIIQAVHPIQQGQSMDDADVQRGLRRIQPPRSPVEATAPEVDGDHPVENILTENKKKLRPEWQPEEPLAVGSADLDVGLNDEWHYRKTFSETPLNIFNGRKAFYEELPAKLKVARELENRDRLPTKDEQKYPPPTEADLRQERLKKEKKWRNDLQGWILTRFGSQVPWDPRFESLKVLDLNLAKDSMNRNGFVGDRQQEFASS